MLALEGTELDMLICKDSREQRVLQFLPDLAEGVYPADNSIPWYLIWIGALYNAKHRHTLRSRPTVEMPRGDVKQCIEKLKWRSILDKQPSMAVVKIRRPVPACERLVEPEIKAWGGHLRNTILRALQAGAASKGGYNTSKLYLWSLHMLWRSKWCMMTNDKDGSWSLMQRHERDALYEDAVKNYKISE